jgi:hypothetical protein
VKATTTVSHDISSYLTLTNASTVSFDYQRFMSDFNLTANQITVMSYLPDKPNVLRACSMSNGTYTISANSPGICIYADGVYYEGSIN